MIDIRDLEAVFLLVSFVGVLIIASPIVLTYIPSSPAERFTELYILGSEHAADNYPFNIEAGEKYRFYLVVVNQRGCSSYYRLLTKIRNTGEAPPNPVERSPSDQEAFYELPVLLGEGERWEEVFIITFPSIHLENDKIYVPELTLNGSSLQINKTLNWSDEKEGFYAELFFELWIYNKTPEAFQYDNRFVGIWVNVTSPS